MAIVFLEPKDLTAAQSAQILAFLNEAKTAGAIAAKVEFPDEPDIGARLAERLLAARAKLGGRFTTLEQVTAVRLIGPERFTELCAAVLGFHIRRVIGNVAQLASDQAQVAGALDELARRMQHLETLSPPRVELTLSRNGLAWLGEPLDAVVRVHDGAGHPMVNRRLTIEVDRGTLTSVFGMAVQRGQALPVTTTADGTARFTLAYEPIEPLTAEQRDALGDALAHLDVGAETPQALAAAFLALVDRYQGEREEHLRGALDIYASAWRSQFFDRQNPGNPRFAWPQLSSAIRVWCHPAQGQSVVAGATAVATFKNWVDAWFAFLEERVTTGSDLAGAFAAAKGRGKVGTRLAEDLVGETHTFMADQRGLAAVWVGQRAVQTAVEGFLSGGLDDVDDATRETLFATLPLAAHQIGPAGRGTLALSSQTRAELQTRIDQLDVANRNLVEQVGGLQLELQANKRELVNTRDSLSGTITELGRDVFKVKDDLSILKTRF